MPVLLSKGNNFYIHACPFNQQKSRSSRKVEKNESAKVLGLGEIKQIRRD